VRPTPVNVARVVLNLVAAGSLRANWFQPAILAENMLRRKIFVKLK
jgi:hypothetical protein